MLIKEVCEKYNITADTLRYYEKVGVIPEVSRTLGGIRNYSEADLKWIENAICMRNAGVPVELIAEYVKLFPLGEQTLERRRDILCEAKQQVEILRQKCEQELTRLDYKITKYEQAIAGGELNWEDDTSDACSKVKQR